MTRTTTPADALETRLAARFGLSSFRPWQREAVDALLHGAGRALVVAPTGGGKSLTYQFPATELPGTTVVAPLLPVPSAPAYVSSRSLPFRSPSSGP